MTELKSIEVGITTTRMGRPHLDWSFGLGDLSVLCQSCPGLATLELDGEEPRFERLVFPKLQRLTAVLTSQTVPALARSHLPLLEELELQVFGDDDPNWVFTPLLETRLSERLQTVMIRSSSRDWTLFLKRMLPGSVLGRGRAVQMGW